MTPRTERTNLRICLMIAAAALIAVVLGGWYWFIDSRYDVVIPPDPRLTSDSPFLNIKPDVAYVGDEVCSSCHQEICESYSRHSMGRSIEPISVDFGEVFTAEAKNPFQAGPLRYLVEKRDGEMIHSEAHVREGRVAGEKRQPVHYAIGGGGRTRSFLFVMDGGYVFQSPITWYPQKGRWDLSPGYENNNPHFDRPAVGMCLFCHSNRVEPIPGTLNRYEMPLFRGMAIGCERCHGPGGLHIEKQIRKDGIDLTIVNPKHLSPVLRDAVCEQCHLEGEQRIVRRGRNLFDFRPGLPLHDFLSIFVHHDEEQNLRFVGHVEQFHASRCYQASSGEMSCTTCHDPHQLLPVEKRAAFYRQRCLDCHADKPCALPEPQRRRQQADDSCVACHMPPAKSEIQHVPVTDHRIMRRPVAGEHKPPAEHERGRIKPLVHFHAKHMAKNDPGIIRDHAIAVAEMIDHENTLALPPSAAARREAAELLLRLVGPTVRRDPTDWDLRDAEAIAYWAADRLSEAQSVYAAILEAQPKREVTLLRAARLAFQRGEYPEAIRLWRRATAVNPHRWGVHHSLAVAFSELDDPYAALEAGEAALRLYPLSTATRRIMVSSALKIGDVRRAQAEFDRLIALDPPDKETLIAWFQQCLRELRR
ncbi:MAG: tetratricopeptide repeat protein [Gemmatales bacterium]|nr:tetratricopeptide repeat protein [Gemmatales bacterium]MDW8386641.1 tetratricopeptide repeat protein [Gemmatales bacterium]